MSLGIKLRPFQQSKMCPKCECDVIERFHITKIKPHWLSYFYAEVDALKCKCFGCGFKYFTETRLN